MKNIIILLLLIVFIKKTNAQCDTINIDRLIFINKNINKHESEMKNLNFLINDTVGADDIKYYKYKRECIIVNSENKIRETISIREETSSLIYGFYGEFMFNKLLKEIRDKNDFEEEVEKSDSKDFYFRDKKIKITFSIKEDNRYVIFIKKI
jgi:hypothetical protein